MTPADDGEPRFRVFVGDEVKVICRDVSGADCDRAMGATAQHCGNPDHRRVSGRPVGELAAILRAPRVRPRLAFGEDFIDAGDDPSPKTLDRDEFDSATVWVAAGVQRRFCEFHRCTPDEAIANVRLVLDRAVAAGKHYQLEGGAHLFYWRAYKVWVSPNLRLAYSYRTAHQERTPRQTADGIHSRFTRSGDRRQPREERPVPTACVGDVVDGVVSSVVNFGIFVAVDGFDMLVHRTELAHHEILNAKGFVEVGDEITVQVIGVDVEERKVFASLKALGPQP